MVASSNLRSRTLDLLTNIFLRLPLANILLTLPVKKSLSQCNGLGSLPEELVINILLRLPVKSLLQCKSVCKEWHALISSPSFIKGHFSHEGHLTRLVLYSYVREHPGSFYCTYSYFSNETTLERHEVPDNLLLWGRITFFRGPCNGIFCIYVTKNKFAFWNPTTRKLRLIQCCPSYIFDEVGFGLDPLTDDFKIVLIRSRFGGLSPCFAVYTSGNDSWKYLEQESIRDSSACIANFVPGNNTYYNGFYYWIKESCDVDSTVLAFDMHNEIFEETIIMPEVAVKGKQLLHLLNDSLALVSFDPFCGDKHIEIWLMEGKGCWTKFLSAVLPFECLYPYGFWGRNEIIVCTYLDNLEKLMVYNLDSHCARQLNASGDSQFLPFLFKESLFSLKDKDGVQEYDARSVEALLFLGYEGPNTEIRSFVYEAGRHLPAKYFEINYSY